MSLRVPPGMSAEQGRQALTGHLSRRVPWNLRYDIQQVALGDPFVGSLKGHGYDTLKGALEDAFGRPLATVGQGGSIPLCNVFAETMPDAEIFLMGRRGTDVPHSRAERERRSVGDRAHRAGRGVVPRTLCPGTGGSAVTRPFSTEDFAARMASAARQAAGAGLTGVLVTPGPDLDYFTGYQPVAITERITMLVLQQTREPAMIVPVLERPDAEHATGAAALSLTDWADGSDPYAATAGLLDPDGSYAISDSAWAMHVLGLQAALPSSRYTSMTAALPMLRAVKDTDELARLAAAGAAADAAFEQITSVRFSGRHESEIGADLDRLPSGPRSGPRSAMTSPA